jgi:hypothetical protein
MPNDSSTLDNTFYTQFGLQANNVIATTGSIPVGTYCAIQVLSATATITSLTENGATVTGYASITYNQGMMIYGIFTGGVIASGTVKCYSYNPNFK